MSDELEQIAEHLAKLKLRYDRKLSQARQELFSHVRGLDHAEHRFCPRCAYLLSDGVTVCFDCNLDLTKKEK